MALNQTIFKNNNKPEYYHPNCKCVNVACSEPNIVVHLDIRKLSKYLFVETNKSAMMRSMGYYPEDTNTLHNQIIKIIKQQFLENKYTLNKLDIYGQKVKIIYDLPGKYDHIGQNFKCYAGCTIYPNGKIKIITAVVRQKGGNS